MLEASPPVPWTEHTPHCNTPPLCATLCCIGTSAGLPSSDRDLAGCPIVDDDFRIDRPALWYTHRLREVREAGPISWNSNGFWMVNRYTEVREALQDPATFRNDPASPFDLEREVELLPQHLNPPEHTKYRRILNPWFSAVTVLKHEDMARERCIAAIEEAKPRGGCDLPNEFGLVFPTEVFLTVVGLPVEDGELFLPWVASIFSGFFGGDKSDATAAATAAKAYFDAAVSDREAHPLDPADDFLSHLLVAEIDGRRLPRDEVVTIAFTLMLAGLDTTRSQLGYIYWHLATHPELRQQLIAEPALIPTAVEEFCRLYGLLLQTGRKVARDVDFHGCPMKAGDVVWLGLSSADRDPRRFEHPDEFVLDRGRNPHLAFGAGAHHCLGAHLARRELAIALEEWHQRIPDYRLADPEAELIERGGQLALLHVPLVWEV